MQSAAAAPDRPRGAALLVDAWLRLPLVVRAAAPIAAMSLLWWSSSQTPTRRPPNTMRALAHNGMHVVAYAGLAAALWLAWSRRPARAPQPWRSSGAWSVAVAYGLVDELHQSFVPGRVCSLADWLTDACAAALAIVVLRGITDPAAPWRRRAAAWLAACAAAVCAATFTPW